MRVAYYNNQYTFLLAHQSFVIIKYIIGKMKFVLERNVYAFTFPCVSKVVTSVTCVVVTFVLS